MIALTNAWGIFLIIFLNGFGLVSVPKKVFYYSNTEKRIKGIEFGAAQLSEEQDDFEYSLKECAGRLKALKDDIIINDSRGEDFKEKINIMWDLLYVSGDEIFRTVTPTTENKDYAKNITSDKLPNLHYKLKKAIHEFKRTNK